MFLAIFEIALASAKKGAVVEVAKTDAVSMAAYFPFEWMMTAAMSSPIVMIALWVFKEWWDEHKGWKKRLHEDMEFLKGTITQLECRGPEGLGDKIQNKIDAAWDYCDRGRR